MIQEVKSYKTTDGKIFTDKKEAETHQAKLTDLVKLKTEVKDVLNQLIIKLKDIPRAEVKHSYDSEKYEIFNIPENESDLKFLASVKDYCMSVTTYEFDAANYTEHYYDSSCW